MPIYWAFSYLWASWFWRIRLDSFKLFLLLASEQQQNNWLKKLRRGPCSLVYFLIDFAVVRGWSWCRLIFCFEMICDGYWLYEWLAVDARSLSDKERPSKLSNIFNYLLPLRLTGFWGFGVLGGEGHDKFSSFWIFMFFCWTTTTTTTTNQSYCSYWSNFKKVLNWHFWSQNTLSVLLKQIQSFLKAIVFLKYHYLLFQAS